jgi:hypothetical protein
LIANIPQPAKSRLFSFLLDRSTLAVTIRVTFFSHPESIVSLVEQKYYTLLAQVQARKCRASGTPDRHFDSVLSAVSEIGRGLAGKPSKQIRLAFYERFESYGIDPATIMLLVQLALLIYKALEAAGYFDQAEGFQSAHNARAIIGEI